MTSVDIFQIVFIVLFFAVSVIGFLKAATSDEKEDS
jgi:hypothetical protein